MALLELDHLHIDAVGTDGSPVNLVDLERLSVDAGEVVGVVGESGSGKSLTLRAILGLLPRGIAVTGGTIRFEGRDLRAMPEKELRRLRGDRIALISQEPMSALNPTMRIGDQITEGPRRRGSLSRRQARPRAVELLDQVGVPDPDRRARQYPHELSGGMRQRVGIAMALASEPSLLLCDEPTTALDATIQKQVLELITDLAARLHLAVVLVTHDFGVISHMCARTTVMYSGRLVEDGPTREVLRRPQHPYTLGLLSSVPGRAGDTSARRGIPGAPPLPAERPSGCPFHPRCQYALPRCSGTPPHTRVTAAGWTSACVLPPALEIPDAETAA